MTTKRRKKAAPDEATAPAIAQDAAVAAAGPAEPAEPEAPPPAPAAVEAAVRLPAALQIRNAEATAVQLRTACAAGTLRLDGTDVAQCDTAGLQLLVAAIATARAAGMKHEWLATSPALADAARRLGVGALLALPAAG